MDNETIRAVAFMRDGLWIVQAIEYDIRARAYAREDVKGAIIAAFRERLALNGHLGKRGLEGVKRAPRLFEDMFERAAAGGHGVEKDDGAVEVVFA